MWRSLVFVLACLLVTPVFSQEKPKSENPVPVISGDLGGCTAEFTVTGTKLKPIYKAKVEVELRYGFGGFHRTSLEISTNVDGKARVEGLPERIKRPLSFTVSYEGRKTIVMVDPEAKCHGSYNAIVTDKPVKTDSDE